ncbi:unnamed protein product [Ciceribacter selenitireducens ATCC BAA-1503]|uniref:Uncharacterized protein n=1 Tax=Ciceribacter selenitireducens ATCC BAA-1503 TaxID=1336235 RepID=A0A376AHF6_9HYPH|nr:unnamed protein product [Ciceribacter selenitireducens ATCC BAA-1503]
MGNGNQTLSAPAALFHQGEIVARSIRGASGILAFSACGRARICPNQPCRAPPPRGRGEGNTP